MPVPTGPEGRGGDGLNASLQSVLRLVDSWYAAAIILFVDVFQSDAREYSLNAAEARTPATKKLYLWYSQGPDFEMAGPWFRR